MELKEVHLDLLEGMVMVLEVAEVALPLAEAEEEMVLLLKEHLLSLLLHVFYF